MFILPKGTEMTPELLAGLIGKHKKNRKRYKRLYDLYKGAHEILKLPEKEKYKPDNRLVVNFAKYIVDVFNGYFMGKPVKISCDNKDVAKYLKELNENNDLDDNHSELSKHMDIFGHGFELLYQDEDGEVGITYVSPEECFVVYDESIRRKELFGVRYYKNYDGLIEGSFSDSDKITYFIQSSVGFKFYDEESHFFGEVPITEYIENEERQGAFESVETLINAYDKALSEKANDVDYYADAYLKILGAELDEGTLKRLRDSRIINMSGDTEKLIVEFLAKPEADQTQENLIDRLQELIFLTAMIVNYSDESFGTASGEAQSYKTWTMENNASVKERKFTAGLKRRYRLIANRPKSKIPEDELKNIEYSFTRNKPKAPKEESEIAKNLSGITSRRTQLEAIPSIVDDPDAELKRIEEEETGAEDFNHPDRVTNNGNSGTEKPEILEG